MTQKQIFRRRLFFKKHYFTNVKSGFTLIELLVVIAIISLLVSILLPSLQRAKLLAQSAVCKSNTRGLGQCFFLYASDNDGMLPPSMSGSNKTFEWNCKIYDYVSNNGLYLCPISAAEKWLYPTAQIEDAPLTSYIMPSHYNIASMVGGTSMDGLNTMTLSEISHPQEGVLLHDGFVTPTSKTQLGLVIGGTYPSGEWAMWFNYEAYEDKYIRVHDFAANAVFCDGHSEDVEVADTDMFTYK